jgi:hypothetical protein
VGLFDLFRKKGSVPNLEARTETTVDASHDTAILREIDDAKFSHDLRAVVELLPYLPPQASTYGEDAARAVKVLVDGATPEAVAAFDQWYRERTLSGPPRRAWEEMRLGPLDAWVRNHHATVAIATCHHNGFVREKAVRALSEHCHDGTELPFLLVRLNDWVPQVRFVAASGVKGRLKPSYARDWVRSLGLLDRIQGGRRGDNQWLRAPVDALLRRDEHRAELEKGLRSGTPAVRRACVSIAVGTDNPEGLLRLALENPDPVTQSRAADELCKVLNREPLREFLGIMQRGNARTRCLALETRCERFPDEAKEALRAALLDRTPSVRELARFKWQKMNLGDVDFAAFYRDQLEKQQGDALVVALRGLAETGTVNDVATFLKYADDRRGRVREAAIIGLGRCDGQRQSDRLVTALNDPNLGVAKAALRYAKLYLGRGMKIPKRPPRKKAEELSTNMPDVPWLRR